MVYICGGKGQSLILHGCCASLWAVRVLCLVVVDVVRRGRGDFSLSLVDLRKSGNTRNKYIFRIRWVVFIDVDTCIYWCTHGQFPLFFSPFSLSLSLFLNRRIQWPLPLFFPSFRPFSLLLLLPNHYQDLLSRHIHPNFLPFPSFSKNVSAKCTKLPVRRQGRRGAHTGCGRGHYQLSSSLRILYHENIPPSLQPFFFTRSVSRGNQ